MKLWTTFRKTMRDLRGVTIGISLLAVLMALLDLLIYPSYRDSLKDFQMPEAMRGFLGEASDISTPEGFLTSEYFSWIPLLLITLAIVGGSAAFAGEEAAGTMDLLLSQPIKRWELAIAKAGAICVSSLIATLSALIGFGIGLRLVDFELSFGRIAAAVVSTVPLVWLFAGLSLWASAALSSRASAAMLITGYLVLAFFLQILGDVAPVLKSIRQISPFYWSDASHVLIGGFDWARSGMFLALAAFAIALSVITFERRDIFNGERGWSLPRMPWTHHSANPSFSGSDPADTGTKTGSGDSAMAHR